MNSTYENVCESSPPGAVHQPYHSVYPRSSKAGGASQLTDRDIDFLNNASRNEFGHSMPSFGADPDARASSPSSRQSSSSCSGNLTDESGMENDNPGSISYGRPYHSGVKDLHTTSFPRFPSAEHLILSYHSAPEPVAAHSHDPQHERKISWVPSSCAVPSNGSSEPGQHKEDNDDCEGKEFSWYSTFRSTGSIYPHDYRNCLAGEITSTRENLLSADMATSPFLMTQSPITNDLRQTSVIVDANQFHQYTNGFAH